MLSFLVVVANGEECVTAKKLVKMSMKNDRSVEQSCTAGVLSEQIIFDVLPIYKFF